MKRVILFVSSLFAFLVLIGAAATPTVNLYDQYNSYISIVKTTQNRFVMNMLSHEVREKIKRLGKNKFPVLGSFPDVFR